MDRECEADDAADWCMLLTFDARSSLKVALSTRSAQRQTFFNDPVSFSVNHSKMQHACDIVY